MTDRSPDASDVPVACSLSAAQHRQRTDSTARLAARALIDRQPMVGGERLTFSAAADVRGDLESFIAAERECCPFFAFDLREREDNLELTIKGPELARPIIAELFRRPPEG